MAVSQPFASRRDVLDAFEARLRNTHSDLLEQTRLEIGRNMLKTAIIESNLQPDALGDIEIVHEVQEIEPDLKVIKTKNNHGKGWLFVDLHDERFWIIYSLKGSKFFNTAVDDLLTGEGRGLDRLWMRTADVERIGEMGEYEGIKISFGASDVFPEEFLEDDLEFTDLKIDGSGPQAQSLYNILKGTEQLEDFLSLSRIQIRREVEGEFVRERITNDGRFTTRGGSDIKLHTSTVEHIKNLYARLIKSIEDNHIIGAKDQDSGARSQGSPVVIRFSRSVPDVETFLSYIVNARNPFRLWGHSRQTGQQSYKVDGMDTHNGDKFLIEMSPDWIRLYLYDDACGNTALRLYANIQQYYDPAAELVITDA